MSQSKYPHLIGSLELIAQIDPVALDASGNGATIDLNDYGTSHVGFAVFYGTNVNNDGSNYWTGKLQESVDDSTWTDVAAADIVGGAVNAFAVNDDAARDNLIAQLGYAGRQRYVRMVLTETGTITAMPLCAFAYLIPDQRPVTIVVNPAAT